jgi:hypothetical protein
MAPNVIARYDIRSRPIKNMNHDRATYRGVILQALIMQMIHFDEKGHTYIQRSYSRPVCRVRGVLSMHIGRTCIVHYPWSCEFCISPGGPRGDRDWCITDGRRVPEPRCPRATDESIKGGLRFIDYEIHRFKSILCMHWIVLVLANV